MTFSDPGARHLTLKALSIGPAAAEVLFPSRAATQSVLCVHSVFAAAVNLAVEGSDLLVALAGPASTGYPHVVALDYPGDMRSLPIRPGGEGRLTVSSICLTSRGGTLEVGLSCAEQPARRMLPTIPRANAGPAYRACVVRLAGLQASGSSDLWIDALLGAETTGETARKSAGSSLAAALRKAALALMAEARAGQPEPGSLQHAGRALVGRGAGLTPAGDDFLCGFLAAARSAGRDCGRALAAQVVDAALCGAIQAAAASTGDVSASFLRMAVRGYWPGALPDLAQGLAAEDQVGAVRALEELCLLGHSSGSDIATGFLCGLHALKEPRRDSANHSL